MGVYSSNRTQLGMYNSDEIVANENYYGVVGACQMMLEGFQNDQAIFESVLANDFMEAVAVQEGAVDYSVVNEAGIGGFIDKLKEMVRKIWEKIKGLFQTFITKVNNVVVRDNKKFVEKYKKEVLSKNLSKMKYKWSEPKKSGFRWLNDRISDVELSQAFDKTKNVGPDEVKKIAEEVDEGKYLEGILGCELKEFAKEAHEKCFDDEEEVEGLDASRLSDCISVLIESKKALKEIEDNKKSVDKTFSQMMKRIEQARNIVIKSVPGKEDGGHHQVNVGKDDKSVNRYNIGYRTDNSEKAKQVNSDAMIRLNTMQKLISTANTAISKIAGAAIAENKFEIKQARRVFAQAAAFNPKAVKENALLVEAAADAAEYEVESSFNDYEM